MYVSYSEILNSTSITNIEFGKRSEYKFIRWIWMRRLIRIVFNS
jgi:hypothetical protein